MPRPNSTAAATLAALAGGLAGAAAWPPLGQTWLAWICVAPLLLALRGRALSAAALLGWLWGFAYEGGTTWWVQPTLARHTALSAVSIASAHAAMAAILACSTALVAVLIARGARRSHARWWLAPAAWVAVEWARGQSAFWFPWTNLGYTQYEWTALVQTAALTGVSGLSALVVLVNALVADAIAAPRRGLALGRLAAAGGVVLVVATVGALRLGAATPPATVLRVALVDGAVDEREKWQPEQTDHILGRYASLTAAAVAAARPDVVVWPETALPFFLDDPGPRRDHVLDLARRAEAHVLVGAPGMHAAVGRPGVVQRNRLHLIGPDGVERARYDKQVLTPFGEYVPTSWLGAWVRPLASASAPTTPGTGTNTLDLADPRAGAARRLGVLVCYETIFPWLARRAVRDGASVLVTPSNDAWFSHTAAPEQQLGHVAFRAVELGVPVVRAANRGRSAVADPFGRVTWSGRQSVPSWQLVTVALMGTTTAYARFGDWFAIACALLVGCVASPWGRGRHSKSGIAGVNGDRSGRYSIRINDQWRVCFRWSAGDAHEVEIVDYH